MYLLKVDLIKNSLFSGLFLFVISILLFFIKAASVLLVFAALMPGFCYGIVLSLNEKSIRSPGLIIWASTIIYTGCFFMLNLKDDSLWFILRLMLASSIGSVLLFLSYYFIINRSYHFKRTLLCMMLLGLSASIPSAICYYLLKITHYEIFFLAIFIIFPIWQIAFAALLDKCLKKSFVHEQS